MLFSSWKNLSIQERKQNYVRVVEGWSLSPLFDITFKNLIPAHFKETWNKLYLIKLLR